MKEAILATLKRYWTLQVVVAVTACAIDEPSEPPSSEPSGLPTSFPFPATEADEIKTFSDVFVLQDTVILEENDSVVTAEPFVRYDQGLFLVADVHAYQVRVYTTRGELVQVAGRMGQGPGEFLSPVSVRRASDGGLLVVDPPSLRLTRLPFDVREEPVATPLSIVAMDAVDLGEQLYLVSGTVPQNATSPTRRMLHLWNADKAEIERSFLPLRTPAPIAAIVGSMTMGAEMVVRDDTVWAVLPMSDSVYKLRPNGSQLDALPLPLAEQLHLETSPADEHWRIFGLHVTMSRKIVVQVMREVSRKEFVYNLVIMDRDGNIEALLADTPQLRVVADDVFYFQDPERLEPNRWIAAYLANT